MSKHPDRNRDAELALTKQSTLLSSQTSDTHLATTHPSQAGSRSGRPDQHYPSTQPKSNPHRTRIQPDIRAPAAIPDHQDHPPVTRSATRPTLVRPTPEVKPDISPTTSRQPPPKTPRKPFPTTIPRIEVTPRTDPPERDGPAKRTTPTT